MKKIFLLFTGLFVICFAQAQSTQDSGGVEIFYGSEFHLTKPLSELAAEYLNQELSETGEKPESFDRQFRVPYMAKINPDAQPQGEDPAAQKTMGSKGLVTILASWNGQSGSGVPPDPSGSAGPNHYVQAVNTAYRIYTKTGGSVSGGGPFNLGTLLFGINDGDPIVLYDKFADRWFISQFGVTGKKIYIGISQSSDPTGAYYTWQWTSAQFPDYLKFSIWHDGYYMTSNQATQKVQIFERSAMLAGGVSPRMISKNISFPTGGGFFCPLTADADGQLPPAGTPCPVFSFEDDGWGGSYADRINVYEITTTWGGTPVATFTGPVQLSTQPFDASYDYYWNDISQPGTTAKLDGIGGVFTFRAQHRVWSGYSSVVLCKVVKVNSTQRGIRWYELRKNTSTGVWSIFQQGTYAPDALNRWCGSIAMDDNGGIGMAYSVSGVNGGNVYPGIRVTGRSAGDPPGTMTFTETTGMAGSGVQTFTNRWGDYSHTALDPTDGTIFWHTGEYLSNGSSRTKIFSFRLSPSSGIADNTVVSSLAAYQNGGVLVITASALPNSNNMIVDLFDINGNKISAKVVTPVDNSFVTSFDIDGIAEGIYLIRIGENNTSFQKVIKVHIY